MKNTKTIESTRNIKSSKFLPLALLIILMSIQAFSQNELRMQMGMEVPRGELKWIYKPAASISLEYGYLNDVRKGFSEIGFGLKYFRFIPKEPIFYYLVSATEYGTATYSNYSVLQLYCTYRRLLPLSQKFDIFLGGNAGYTYIKYGVDIDEPGANIQTSVLEGKGCLSPNVGLNFKLTEKVGLSFQSKYNIYFSIGQNQNTQKTNYNPDVGSINFFWTNDLGIYFRF